MLKNIQKSSLKTLDELSAMASVAEKIANLESKEGENMADDTAAAAASLNPPNSDQLQEEEEEEEGGGQEAKKAEKYTTYDPKNLCL